MKDFTPEQLDALKALADEKIAADAQAADQAAREAKNKQRDSELASLNAQYQARLDAADPETRKLLIEEMTGKAKEIEAKHADV